MGAKTHGAQSRLLLKPMPWRQFGLSSLHKSEHRSQSMEAWSCEADTCQDKVPNVVNTAGIVVIHIKISSGWHFVSLQTRSRGHPMYFPL
jgi:hypothetical protein